MRKKRVYLLFCIMYDFYSLLFFCLLGHICDLFVNYGLKCINQIEFRITAVILLVFFIFYKTIKNKLFNDILLNSKYITTFYRTISIMVAVIMYIFLSILIKLY